MCPCASIADHRSGAQSSQKRLSRITLIFDTALSEDMNGHCRGLAEAPRHSDIESLASHFGESASHPAARRPELPPGAASCLRALISMIGSTPSSRSGGARR